MAPGRLRTERAVVYFLSFLFSTVHAAPAVAFPFNSQVPTVARVGQPYLFQLSTSTFAPEATNFTYSLSDQPEWLTIDSAGRTLLGTPSPSDVGASTFTMTAADDTGAAHMLCTLVVSADPAPSLDGDVSRQLAATANLSSSDPPVVTVLPSADFHFNFEQSSFIDIVQRKLYYYATLTDRTPLPSWVLFDSQNLAFSGTAPLLSAFPQSWGIDLIASDVAGFAGATASFTIAIGTQQLVFVPAQQNVSITSGTDVSFTSLQSQLFRNGQLVSPQSLSSAKASALPPWLSFDPSNLAFTGQVPADVSDEAVSVTVTDGFGDTATAIVNFVSSEGSLFAGTIGVLTAYSGQTFNYNFPDSLFSDPHPLLSVAVPTTATWLHFDSGSRKLYGVVPSATSPAAVTATLIAKPSAGAAGQSQVFTLDIKTSTSIQPTSSRLATRASPTNSSTSTPLPALTRADVRPHLSRGIVVAIVIVSIIVAVLLIGGLLVCIRRRQRDGYERHSATPVKRKISRPIPPPETDAITVTTVMERDVEKAQGGGVYGLRSIEADAPPQIALNLPSHSISRKSRWLKRFSHISQVSSLGVGEDAIRADTNIPEWGADTEALHTPHDSFSVPAEIARVSRQLSQTSPTKRAMRRLRERRESRQSVGLGIDTIGESMLPRHSSRQSRNHRRGASSFGLSAAMDRSSQASLSTRGTSVLSTRPSDFPRPPTRSTFTTSRSIPTLSITDADRHKSIRLVGRSDSVTDSRSMADKRKSFIRNRASTSLQSPLFAHGSRAPSVAQQNGAASTAASSAGSVRRSRRGKSMLTSYSQSSSLEPQGRESRRLSARVRSAFAPNFPRAITRSSLGADDEGAGDDGESSSGFETTSSSISDDDLRAEMALAAKMALPRHKRSWVRPGEASPTPPPAPPTSRQASSARHTTPSGESSGPRQRWKDRIKDRSSSPLSTAVAVPAGDPGSVSAIDKVSQARKSRLSEPLSLVSNDSVSRARPERPRLVHTNSKRPVSVEEVKRLSSLKAETGTKTDTQAGSEMWEDTEHGSELEGSGLMPKPLAESKSNTQRSNMSGPAFL
ncbi:hypothetical protein LTR65_008523 [Meristemomyces frigidus]